MNLNEITLVDSNYYDVLLSIDPIFRHKYSLLINRLYHPSGMVKERTCSSIGKLLLNADYTKSFSALLSQWIISQKLEIHAVYGALGFLKAKIMDDSFDLTALKVALNRLNSPSLLLFEICKNYFATDDLSSISLSLHSAKYPESYDLNNFFQKYEYYFVSPSYRHALLSNTSLEALKLITQWCYESDKMMSDLNFIPDADILNYKGRSGLEHHTSFNSILSDIYTSAYLRAIAWGRSMGLSPEDERHMLLLTCPMNLDIWKINPKSRPKYWLTVEKKDDFILKSIWDQVDALWLNQSGRKWKIGYINGRIGENKSYYDLAIHSFIYEESSLENIEQEMLFSSLDYHPIPNKDLGVHCKGQIQLDDLSAISTSSNPNYIPLSSVLPLETGLNWQFWRHHRLIHFPSLYIIEPPMNFECFTDGLYFTENGELVAIWSDWTDGVTEKRESNLSLRTGNILEISEDKILSLQKYNSLNYGWACKLTEYSKNNRLEYDIQRYYHIIC